MKSRLGREKEAIVLSLVRSNDKVGACTWRLDIFDDRALREKLAFCQRRDD